MTQCKNCHEGVTILGVHEIIITRDMAIDGGIGLEYVGSVWSEEEELGPCDCCYGNWQDCEQCTLEEEHGND